MKVIIVGGVAEMCIRDRCMVMAIYTGHKMITGNRKKKANKEKDTEREG